MEYVTFSATQKNLSGTNSSASPEGVRRLDVPNNLGQKTRLDHHFFPRLSGPAFKGELPLLNHVFPPLPRCTIIGVRDLEKINYNPCRTFREYPVVHQEPVQLMIYRASYYDDILFRGP